MECLWGWSASGTWSEWLCYSILCPLSVRNPIVRWIYSVSHYVKVLVLSYVCLYIYRPIWTSAIWIYFVWASAATMVGYPFLIFPVIILCLFIDLDNMGNGSIVMIRFSEPLIMMSNVLILVLHHLCRLSHFFKIPFFLLVICPALVLVL